MGPKASTADPLITRESVMSVSRQCIKRARSFLSYLVSAIFALCSGLGHTGEPDARAPDDCDPDGVLAHVRGQFSIYGPRSDRFEYFGFIYRLDGVIASAMVKGNVCRGHDDCMVDARPAARLIPKGAKVLGEWHTHPHFLKASRLSNEDVRGARANSHIRCYTAYYAGSNGEFFSWRPTSTSVPEAMGTRIELGNYRKPAAAVVVAAGG